MVVIVVRNITRMVIVNGLVHVRHRYRIVRYQASNYQ